MIVQFPGADASRTEERDKRPVTVKISLRFDTIKKLRTSFETQEAFDEYQRERSLGEETARQQPYVMTLPPADRWTSAELDLLLSTALQLMHEAAAKLRVAEVRYPSKREAYRVSFRGESLGRNRVAVPWVGICVDNHGLYDAEIKFEGGFPIMALLGWMAGLRFDLCVHWYQPSLRKQTQYGQDHEDAHRAKCQ